MDPASYIIIAIAVGVLVVAFFILYISKMSRKNKEAHPELNDIKGFRINRKPKN